MFTADYFIAKLGLEAHIEGGYFREIYRNARSMEGKCLRPAVEGERSTATTIYFLLKSGQVSKFHRLTSDEIWFYHYGSPLIIHMLAPDGRLQSQRLGLNIENDEMPQIVVPSNTIFGAEVAEENSFGLVGCMVSPGFDYRDFTLFSGEELINLYPQHKGIIERLNGE